LLGEFFDNGAVEVFFLMMDALEKLVDELEAFVVMSDFSIHVGTVKNHVEVVVLSEGGVVRFSPRFGIEMKAKDEVGLDFLIYFLATGTDFSSAVEELFGCFSNGLGDRGLLPFFEEFFSSFDEVMWAKCRDWGIFVSDKGDTGTEIFESRLDEFGDLESHFALHHRSGVLDGEVAFFHLCEIAANMSGVYGDTKA